eukprot:TRINITY_DN13775_c0_g2_i1.p1 TRINITY_DN13775_c0_g2~~TRINITY_DN13775_c0_g2_i1.p1  ORF type:complete len:254 (+),score=80.65 TRINITY_DN13775_c0_g2_i1:47-763(+)
MADDGGADEAAAVTEQPAPTEQEGGNPSETTTEGQPPPAEEPQPSEVAGDDQPEKQQQPEDANESKQPTPTEEAGSGENTDDQATKPTENPDENPPENRPAVNEDEQAAKIQAMYRGGKGREQAKQKRVEKELETQMMNEKATKIQACYRGGKARTDIKEKKAGEQQGSPPPPTDTGSIPSRITFPVVVDSSSKSDNRKKTKWEPADPNAELRIYEPTVHPINKQHVHEIIFGSDQWW